jgi:nucleoside-diphosphate-sugar epimerase
MAFYLVTGGAGFIGSNIVNELHARGDRVRVLDDFSTGKRENLKMVLHSGSSRFELIEGNICDLEICRNACKDVDYVLHHAALGSVFRSIDNPLETHEVNVKGTLNMLVASREAKVKRFIYASSSSVYGDVSSSSGEIIPKQEGMNPCPKSPYAVSKLASEYYAQVFYQLYGVEAVILRYFNVFGERQDPYSIYSAVIPRFIKSLLSGQSPTIYGDGEQSRDFTYVGNVIQANLKACKVSAAVAGEVMNIASGERVSINQLYQKLSHLIGQDVPPLYAQPRPGEVRHSLADITKAKELLEYRPEVDWRGGLMKTVQWFKSCPI